VEHQDQPLCGYVIEIRDRQRGGREYRLGRGGVRHPFEDATSQDVHAHVTAIGRLEEIAQAPDVFFVYVDRLENGVRIQCGRHEVRTFEDARPLAPTKRSLLAEAPQSAHSGM
jgi:hypothetical protein